MELFQLAYSPVEICCKLIYIQDQFFITPDVRFKGSSTSGDHNIQDCGLVCMKLGMRLLVWMCNVTDVVCGIKEHAATYAMIGGPSPKHKIPISAPWNQFSFITLCNVATYICCTGGNSLIYFNISCDEEEEILITCWTIVKTTLHVSQPSDWLRCDWIPNWTCSVSSFQIDNLICCNWNSWHLTPWKLIQSLCYSTLSIL